MKNPSCVWLLYSLLFCSLVMPLSTVRAQSVPNWEWAIRFGCPGATFGEFIKTDSSNNVYVAGQFMDSVYFDTIRLDSRGQTDHFLAKFTPHGQVVWVTQLGGNNYDELNKLEVDPAGNCYLTGNYFGDFHVDSVHFPAAGLMAAYVAKINNSGQLAWAKPVTGPNGVYRLDMAFRNQNLYLTGLYTEQIEFDGQIITTNYGIDCFVVQLDTSGAIIWDRNLNNAGNYRHIDADEKGNYYLAGTFSGYASFGGIQLYSTAGNALYLVKYDSAGTVQWATMAEGDSLIRIQEMAVTGSGNVYLTGGFGGILQAGTVSLNSPAGLFLLRFNEFGLPQWGKQSTGQVQYNSYVSTDTAGVCYLSVALHDSSSFAGIPFTVGPIGFILLKIAPDGTIYWSKTPDAVQYGAWANFTPDQEGNFYVTGMYNTPITFGSTTLVHEPNASWAGMFLAKLSSDPLALPPTHASGAYTPLAFPNPFSEQLTIQVTSNSKAGLQLFDLLGRKIWEDMDVQVSENGLLQVNTVKFAKGTYLLRVLQPSGYAHQIKLIKQ